MLLPKLIADDQNSVTLGNSSAAAQLDITGMTSDSREVKPGYLFAAWPGTKGDGRDHIADAIKRGAVAILTTPGTTISEGAVLIADANPRRRLAKMAARFYGQQPKTLVAVTGTNGKSSTVNFCRQIWRSLQHTAASLGTIGVTISQKDGKEISREGSLTTPGAVALQAEVAELDKMGVTHLALEASSMGLDQFRLDGLKVTAAGFTNLTRDHLDYHGTMENYFESKRRLFTDLLPQDGVAVINMDTPYSEQLAKDATARGCRLIRVGKAGTEIRLTQHKPLSAGQRIEIDVFGDKLGIELPLVGDFQAMNALLALGLTLAENPGDKNLRANAVQSLTKLQSVRGRLEFAGQHKNGATIYVDYAHTPDGLETMLHALRPHTQKKLHVVFGCGGDRDKGKRPMMGEIAARLADRVIVTDDNPRTEAAATIRTEVMKGCPGAEEIGGRREAIRRAIRTLESGDVLVIAGKGHEQGQIVGTETLPFDDVTEAKNALLEAAA